MYLLRTSVLEVNVLGKCVCNKKATLYLKLYEKIIDQCVERLCEKRKRNSDISSSSCSLLLSKGKVLSEVTSSGS